MSLRNIIPKRIKKPIRILINKLIWFKNTVKYITVKFFRTFIKNTKSGLAFSILCVKKTVYADMTIDNVNSLHYLNPNHDFYIYCDNICSDYLTKRKNRFTYPKKVFILNKSYDPNTPWQYHKINVVIDSAKNDRILTDADGFWYQDPKIDKDKITMMVLAYKISENKYESLLLNKILNKDEIRDFSHYVSGLVSIPSQFMTDKLEKDLKDIIERIFKDDLDFLPNQFEKDCMRRIGEEISVNIALQLNVPSEKIVALKTNGDPANKEIVQSFYYGCINNINE